MGFRRAAKVDSNHQQIVRELRALGYRVDNVSQVKKLYDIVVTGRLFGSDEVRTVRVELKSPGGRMTPDEVDYHTAEPYPQTLLIAYSTEDVQAWFSTKNNSLENVVTGANVVVEILDTTPTMSLSTTSKRKAKLSTRSSTTRATSFSSTTTSTSPAVLTQESGG